MRAWLSLLSAVALLAAPPTGDESQVRVRLKVYAPVPQEVLELAKNTAGETLRQAGVRLRWVRCPARRNDGPNDPICDSPVTPLDLQLHIIDETMARRAGMVSECMGYAIVAGSIANAFYHSAVQLEGIALAGRGAILGSIMAHEIGHLLEIPRHSLHGIMRASWSREELRYIAQGQLWFNKFEARRLRTAAAKRLASIPEANPTARK
jgi:hypothetical protein